VASCAPRCNGATVMAVMDRARLFPAADRLPVVPSQHRSKGTAREALRGLISGTFRLALSGERRALWSAVALTSSRLYLAIDLLPAVPANIVLRTASKPERPPGPPASPPLSSCSRPPATSRTPRPSRVRRQRRPDPHLFALHRYLLLCAAPGLSRIRSPLTFSVSETCLSRQPSVSGPCLTAWSAESSVLPDVAAMNLNTVSRARVHVRLAG